MSSTTAPPSVKELDAPLLEALIETMFLAAYADGEFSDKERAHFHASIESLTDRRISGTTLDALLARIMGARKAEGQPKRLLAVKERLGSEGACRTALALTIQLVAADGIIHDAEREHVFALAAALEIDRDTAADLLKQIAG